MSVLDEDTILREIIPHLSWGKRGKKSDPQFVLSIVQLILYRLKTGCQWRFIPIKTYISGSYSWQSVFHHFNKWSKDGSWERAWSNQLRAKRSTLALRTIQLDGSQTYCKRGGEAVGYQGRRRGMTSNSLFISDEKGVILAISQPQSGNHHDSFGIATHFEGFMVQFKRIGIDSRGLTHLN